MFFFKHKSDSFHSGILLKLWVWLYFGGFMGECSFGFKSQGTARFSLGGWLIFNNRLLFFPLFSENFVGQTRPWWRGTKSWWRDSPVPHLGKPWTEYWTFLRRYQGLSNFEIWKVWLLMIPNKWELSALLYWIYIIVTKRNQYFLTSNEQILMNILEFDNHPLSAIPLLIM